MVTEDQKYIAQFFQISSFCCMTPLGKFILSIGELTLSDITIMFVIYLIISVVLFLFGIILAAKGLETIEERRSKWNQQ